MATLGPESGPVREPARRWSPVARASYFENANQATQTKKATVMTTNTTAASPSMKVIVIPQLERQHGPKHIDGDLGE